jgi:3-isopropylmalate/(R)-2-methylmalate dehydratase small subunit
MSLKQIKSVFGNGVFVTGNDIDTDRIIPARFMKCVTFEGLGKYTFYDVRFDELGNSKNHQLDKLEHQGASILISGSNFGCGSSREHAPQALFHFAIRAIIAESFAEIFFGNCTTLGIPCVTVTHEIARQIGEITEQNPKAAIEIDLEKKLIKIKSDSSSIGTYSFEIPENARISLVNGEWDSLGELLSNQDTVKELVGKLPYANNWK